MSESNHKMNTTAADAEAQRADLPQEINFVRLAEDILAGIRIHWLALLVVMSLTASLFYLHFGRRYEPVYQASSTFLVNTNSAISTMSDYYNIAAARQIARTFPFIISNNAMRKLIMEDLHLSYIPGSINAEALEETNMITISVTSGSPQDAYDVLQSVLNNYQSVAKQVIGNTSLIFMNETGLPTQPINARNTRRMPLYGALAALVAGIALIGATSLMKNTIRSEEDFRNILNLHCLGTIPLVRFKLRTGKKRNKVLITNDRVSYGFVEGIRTVRTRIERDHAEHGGNTYLISSAIAGEGKSTIAVNLALSLVSKGLDVVLVDLDMRNSSVSDILDLPKDGKGMADVLTRKAVLMDVMVTDEESGLKVIPAGDAGSNSVRLINGDLVKGMISALKKDADYVIIDTPPIGLISDAASIAPVIDGGIFVVRQDWAPIDRVREGVELLADSGMRICGCVLNGGQAGISHYVSYGYGGYGGYGRYGSYGGHYSKRRRKKDKTEEDES